MELETYTESSIDVLQLRGEVDLRHAGSLRGELKRKAENKCRALLLDVSRLRSIDALGVAAIIEYLRASTQFGGRFCIGGAGEHLRGMLK